MAEAVTVVGKPVERKGLREKLTGQAQYTADLKLPGMLYGKVLRSPHAHARVLRVDASRALQLPGVHAVLTPFNVPQGLVDPDMPILDTEVRFVGDEVAAVVAEDEDLAEEALGLIEVEYQVLPFVLDPEEALQPDAPRVHAEGNLVDGKPMVLERGSVEEGFAQADLVIEGNYRTQVHSGAALEPRAALATWEDGHLTIWKSSRGVHVDRAHLARTLDLPLERVRVIGGFLGGGFGNKDEGRLGALAALLARETGRPMRIEYTRQEEFVAGRVRPETLVYLKVGVKRDGTITAIYARSVMNSGAYTASSPRVLRRVGQAALYLYTCPSAKFEGFLAYTNCPVGGSYRGLGALQGHFALEVHMDKVAEALGMDPLEFRLRNGVKPEGQPGVRQTPPDQIVDTQPVEGGIPFSSNGLEECLRKGAQAIGWQQRRPPNSDAGPLKRGMGVAMCIYRGGPAYEESGAEVRVSRDGTVQLLAGVMEVGEGVATVLAQICAETLGVRYEQVQTLLADTKQTLKA
ncbi:MAG: xanthine dehydrogenase family protein molybdopterin-binding subunit, partial [Dehalococcoidia bacterium]